MGFILLLKTRRDFLQNKYLFIELKTRLALCSPSIGSLKSIAVDKKTNKNLLVCFLYCLFCSQKVSFNSYMCVFSCDIKSFEVKSWFYWRFLNYSHRCWNLPKTYMVKIGQPTDVIEQNLSRMNTIGAKKFYPSNRDVCFIKILFW